MTVTFEHEVTAATPEAVAEGRPVTVSVMFGDCASLDFEPGLTVGQYLQNAEVQLTAGQVVTNNGAPVGMNDIVEENSHLVIVGKIANG